MNEKDQPRDYVVQSFEDAMKEAYETLGFFEKVYYHMQRNVNKLIVFGVILGYAAGGIFR